MRTILFGSYFVAAGLLLLAAGCGIQEVQPHPPTAVPTVAIPTPTPTPKVVVTGGHVALVINGRPIPMSIFRDYLHSALQQEPQSAIPLTTAEIAKKVLARLILNEVVIQEAQKRGLGPTPGEVTTHVDDIIAGEGGRAKFEGKKKSLGWNNADVVFLARTSAAQNNLTKALFPLRNSGPVVTGRVILIASNYRPPQTYALFYPSISPPATDRCENKVLTDGQALAEASKFFNRIKHGASFSQIATRCSDDLSTAPSGGMLHGILSSNIIYPYTQGNTPAFEAALFKGKVGTLQLVGSPGSPDTAGHFTYGWSIVQVNSRHTASYQATVAPVIQADHFDFWNLKQAASAHVKILAVVR